MTQADFELLDVIKKTEQNSLVWSLDAVGMGARQGREQGVVQLMFLNAHGINWAADDDTFRQRLLDSDFLLRDGIGLALGLKMLGLSETENLNGTDLIPKILERHKTADIAVWGSSEEALQKLEARLQGEGFTRIVSLEHGFHEDAYYIEKYQELRPEILVLCMGMPRQELLSGKLAETVSDTAENSKKGGLVICGGGWANFHSGHIQRAPLWVQRLRLEWLHRLSREPARLGKRYTVDIVRYFLTVRRIKRASGTQ